MTKARDIADSDLEDLVVQNDIEVSGGIFLGGTGSANKLDDYEEGTFVPEVYSQSGGETVGLGANNTLAYVKVGNTVTVTGTLRVDSVSGTPSGSYVVVTMPFAAANLIDNSVRARPSNSGTPGGTWKAIPVGVGQGTAQLIYEWSPTALVVSGQDIGVGVTYRTA